MFLHVLNGGLILILFLWTSVVASFPLLFIAWFHVNLSAVMSGNQWFLLIIVRRIKKCKALESWRLFTVQRPGYLAVSESVINSSLCRSYGEPNGRPSVRQDNDTRRCSRFFQQPTQRLNYSCRTATARHKQEHLANFVNNIVNTKSQWVYFYKIKHNLKWGIIKSKKYV